MTDCPICAEEIAPTDGVTARSFPEGPNPAAEDPPKAWSVEDGYWAHVVCTDDGVKRWNRVGRPGDSPLDWARSNGLNWTGLSQQSERASLILD